MATRTTRTKLGEKGGEQGAFVRRVVAEKHADVPSDEDFAQPWQPDEDGARDRDKPSQTRDTFT